MDKKDKVYLMLAGTFLPAFVGVFLYSTFTKKKISASNSELLILFAALSSYGGYASAKMIKKYDKENIQE